MLGKGRLDQISRSFWPNTLISSLRYYRADCRCFRKILRQWDFSVNSHQYCGYDDKVVGKGTGMFRKSLLCNLHRQGKTQYTKTLTPYHMRHVVVSYHDEDRILTYCRVTSMVRLIKAGGLTSHPPKGLQADWTSHHSLYVSRDDPHFAIDLRRSDECL